MGKNIPSIKRLRKICQPPIKDWPWHEKLTRPISIYFTKIFLYFPISANKITFIWGILGFSAVILLSFGYYWLTITAVALFFLVWILDCVDGEIARYRGTTSECGAYLDVLFHCLVDSLVFVALSFGIYNNYHNSEIFLFGSLAALSLLWRQIILQDKDWKGMRNLIIKKQHEQKGFLVRLAHRIPRGLWGHEAWTWLILAGVLLDFIYFIVVAYGIFLPIYALIETIIHYRIKCKTLDNKG